MAAYYFLNTGSQSFNTGSNWSLGDGGAPAGIVPGSSDEALFTSLSGDCTVDASGITINNLTVVDGYDKTITLTNSLTVSNIYRFTGNHTLSGAGEIILNGSIDCGASRFVSGTAVIRINGTGSWLGQGVIATPLTINTAGTFTFDTSSSRQIASGCNFTYTAGTVVTTGSTFAIGVGAVLTLNIPGLDFNNVSFSGQAGSNITLSSDFNINGSLTIAGAVTFSTTTQKINLLGDLIHSHTSASIGGVRIVMTGVGVSWTSTGNANISTGGTIDLNGDITIGSVGLNFATLNYIGGAVTHSGTLRVIGNSTIDSAGITWQNVFRTGAQGNVVLTLLSNMVCSSYTTATANVDTVNGFTISVSGGLTVTSNVATGTTNFILNGTGTWSGAGTLRNNLTINTAGTITVSGTVRYDTGTITYTAGTVVTTSSTLSISGSSTLNTNGITWNNVSITTGTATLNSLLTATGTTTLGASGNVTFAGTSGFTTHTLVCTTAGRTIIYVAGVTYTATNNITVTGTSASKILFISSSLTVRAILTLTTSGTQNVSHTNATRIDSSGGETIYSVNATLTDTINWSAATFSGGNGSNSTFNGLTAIGGGGGGAEVTVPNTTQPASGGSGGGSSNNNGSGAAGTSGQGNSGGNSDALRTGGGGGAGASGGDGTGSNNGNGGVGISSSITGAVVFYAGGGGGGRVNNTLGTATTGGNGGGGAGASAGADGVAGTANTGGGGGGGGTASTNSGAGGSGVLILRYKFK